MPNQIRILLNLIFFAFLISSTFVSFGQETEVKFDSVKITCLYLIRAEKSYIINSNHEYEKLLTQRAPNPECSDYTLPEIDFNKKTLIGYLTTAGGCSPPKLFKSITFDKSEYKVKVKIQTVGACRKGFRFLNWFLIDKISDNQKIKFETIY